VRPEHGRFRAFLPRLGAELLHNARDHERALKRGGGRRLVSLDAEEAERTYGERIADQTNAGGSLRAAWARTVFGDNVLGQLEERARRQGKAERVARLRPF